MEPIDQLTDDELAARARQAAALPDAPREAIDRACALWPKKESLADAARAGSRLLAAVLRFDSWAASAPALGMRSLPADTRHLLFSAKGRDVDLRVTPSRELFSVTGQVLGPDDRGRVELKRTGSTATHVTSLDDLGEFRLEGLARGTYLLTLRMGTDEIALPPIEVGERRS